MLWVYVHSKERIEMSFVVPLELRNLPSSLVVASEVTEFVDITLRGTEPLLRDLSTNQVSVHLDLSDGREGENTYQLSEENAKVPLNVKVTRIRPSRVKIRLESMSQSNLS